MASPLPLAGRVAVVTGASRRTAVGAGIARRRSPTVPPCWCTPGRRITPNNPGVPTPAVFTSGQYHAAMPDELPYIASKAALHQLTPSLAAHLMPRGITVNCVNPGPNDTGYADAEAQAAVATRNPGRRWSTPADTARLVAWLAGDEAEWITGQVIVSDGGRSALG